MNPNRLLHGMARTCCALLALCALATGASAQVTVTPPGDLADVIENATAGQVIRLQANGIYTLSRTVAIRPGVNDGLVIRGSGGTNARPDKLILDFGTAASIELEEGTSLTLENLTISGGSPWAILVPTNCNLTASQCLFKNGNPSIRMAGSPATGGSLRAQSCVFANSNVAVQHDGGVATFVQCTFTGVAPASVRSKNGSLTVAACLFETIGDRPAFDASFDASKAFWYGNLTGPGVGPGPVTVTGTENQVPTTQFQGAAVQAVPPAAITYSTAPDAWPGKLDISATPLLSGLAPTAASIQVLFGTTRREDFEGDLRGTAIQVGADELAAAQLAGWIGSTITTVSNTRNASDLVIAGASKKVTIVIEVRGINLDDAELVIIPELGSETTPDNYAVLEVNPIGDSYGYVDYTTPASACFGGEIWDGRAQVYLRTSPTATLIRGTDANLPTEEYQFIIDTTPPVLGSLGDRPFDELRLGEVLSSNDPAGVASTLGANAFDAVEEWEPGVVGGLNPTNRYTLGDADGSPQVFFNFDPVNNNAFTLPMQFFDDVPQLDATSPCAGSSGFANLATIDIAGFELTPSPPATVAIADDAFKTAAELDNVNDPKGQPYLSGEVPEGLRTAVFLQEATTSSAINTSDVLDADWTFSALNYANGWRPELLPAATDLAGNRYVHPNPIVFSWLLETDLAGTGVKLQFSGDEADPSFAWGITRSPALDVKETFPCYPVVSYRLWRADNPAQTTEGYEAISDWSPYTATASIDRNTLFVDGAQVAPLGQILADSANVGQAMMLTIMVGDEAGNLQENNMVGGVSGLALTSDRIDSRDALVAEGIVPSEVWTNEADLSGTVDTRLRAKLFWNRVYPNLSGSDIGEIRRVETFIPGERDFGSSTRVPLPPVDDCGAGIFTRLEAQFSLTASSTVKACAERLIRWQLTEDGRIVGGGLLRVYEAGNYSGVVQIPQDLIQPLTTADAEDLYGFPFAMSLDPIQELLQDSPCPSALFQDRMGDDGIEDLGKRRRAIKYVFSAATLAEINCDDTDPAESSPVTFQFVVTPSDEFDDRGDEQPTKVFSPR